MNHCAAIPGRCWALIPLKAPGLGKQRLAGLLPAALRQRLIERMARRVVEALRRCTAIDGIAVVSPAPLAGVDRWLPDPTTRAGRSPGGSITLRDPLNAALAAGADALAAEGVQELLVLHADLPWIEPDDVDAMLDAGRRSGVALAADEAARGTNALFTRLPATIGFAFGRDSLRRHAALARRAGLAPAIVNRRGLACDIDEPQQIDAALAARLGLPLDRTRELAPGCSGAAAIELSPDLPLGSLRRPPWPPAPPTPPSLRT